MELGHPVGRGEPAREDDRPLHEAHQTPHQQPEVGRGKPGHRRNL